MNTYSFMNNAPNSRIDATQAFTLELDAFYTALISYLHAGYQWNNMTVEYVDLLDERPRLPFASAGFGTGVVSGTNYDQPAETSLCLSMVGASESGVNMRRRRGRVYLGPFQFTAVDQPLAATAMATTIANAGANLMVNPAYVLCVYSRYTHFGVPVGRRIDEKLSNGDPVFDEIPDALPSSFTPVTGVYCDNAWDTQRRRGLKPTQRIYGT